MTKQKMRVDDLLAEAYSQIQDDRKKICDSYDKYSAQINNLGDYAVNGQNLNKCLELMMKQTGQLVELCKMQDSRKSKTIELEDDDEKDTVYKAINGGLQ